MRAWRMTSYRESARQLCLDEMPAEKAGPGELVIDVKAASINPIDYKLLRGDLKRVQRLRFPQRIGYDASGVVTAIGANVSGFAHGDVVYARSHRDRMGTFAEQVALRAEWVAPRPQGLDHRQAAGLPLVGLTTVQGLRDRAAARAGQQVLIHAGAGGVGTFAIQYARAIGLEVTTTTSSRNAEFVASLGAQHIVRYDREDYRRLGARFDIVYDTLGGEHTAAAFDLLRPGGSVVSIAGPPDRAFADQINAGPMLRLGIFLGARKIWQRADRGGFRYFRFLTEPDGAQLREIASLVEAGKIKPMIDSVYAFEALPAALKRCAEGRARGKIIVALNREGGDPC